MAPTANSSSTTPIRQVYDLGLQFPLEVTWYPPLREKFEPRLAEIAARIGAEMTRLGTMIVFHHQFDFADEGIMFISSFDDARCLVALDADLIGGMERVGMMTENGTSRPIMASVPKSGAVRRQRP